MQESIIFRDRVRASTLTVLPQSVYTQWSFEVTSQSCTADGDNVRALTWHITFEPLSHVLLVEIKLQSVPDNLPLAHQNASHMA